LIELLQKFEILFKMKIVDPLTETEKEILLIPSLLPIEIPQNFNEIWKEETKDKKGDWFNNDENLNFFFERIYTFQFLPLGFFSKLMVRIISLENVVPLSYYQSGIIIKSNLGKAFIKYTDISHKLIIETIENNSGSLLSILINLTDTLIEGW
jgi:hypothetical protein